MGTSCDLTLLGGDDALLERAVARVEELEARWSRFRPTSELLRLHAHPGRPVVVSDDTFAVLELAVSAWRDTGGAFDPTVHDAVLAAGYTTDFASIPDDGGPVRAAPPAPGLDAVHLDPLVRAVTLPHGVHLDLGGIGKGRAADVVATELLAAGARGVCLSMGGDVRLAGEAPETGWIVAVEEMPGARLGLTRGGIATSARTRRRWRRGDAELHHLIDPRTGRPAPGAGRAVTVIAGTAADAEVLAKALYLLGPEAGGALLERHGATGVVVDDAGEAHPLPGFADYLL